ncbi:hypothetical protein [Achromobacter aloeverae]|uniref:Uncharacterized protein n=1 Tax=Achromobacter aloeverae TaxID=1750518 RepID=A0A4Q1HMR7_9BURK|nr:hypothetical protein [Achromobacter aloeverae]RXN92274.1 hypothetical protein C7R54_00460 [Achromobacter aloeverae]
MKKRTPAGGCRRLRIARVAASLATAAPLWLGTLSQGALPLAAGMGALAVTLAPTARAQGLGSGKEGEGLHNETGQGGGGLGASGSGPQGSGAQGDSHAPSGKDAVPRSGQDKRDDNDAVTNKDVQRLYTPPPQDRGAPASAEKPAR